MTYILIDPPVSVFSTREEIEAWIDELKKLEQTDEVKLALLDAEAMLKLKETEDGDV